MRSSTRAGAARRAAPSSWSSAAEHVRDDLEPAIVGIGIGPIPLVAGHLDGEIGLGRRSYWCGEQPDRRHRDRHQDQHRHQRPDDLERRYCGWCATAPDWRRGGSGRSRQSSRSRTKTEIDDDQRHQDRVVEPDGRRTPIGVNCGWRRELSAVGLADAGRRRGAARRRGRRRGAGRVGRLRHGAAGGRLAGADAAPAARRGAGARRGAARRRERRLGRGGRQSEGGGDGRTACQKVFI